MTRALALALGLLCVACGNYTLYSGGTVPAGKTAEQVRLDKLECKDQAYLKRDSAAVQGRGFMLGLTIVGAPVAAEMEKADVRAAFKGCMEARGYRVIPGTD